LHSAVAAVRPLIFGRDKYATEFSPPPSPLISRRALSPETEAVLHAACASLVSKYHIPSHATEQPKLNFEMLYQSMKDKKPEDQLPLSHVPKDRSKPAQLPFLHPIDTAVSVKRRIAQSRIRPAMANLRILMPNQTHLVIKITQQLRLRPLRTTLHRAQSRTGGKIQETSTRSVKVPTDQVPHHMVRKGIQVEPLVLLL
jgi:hypothetical protein